MITELEKANSKIIEKLVFKTIGTSESFTFDDFLQNGQKCWKKYVDKDDDKKLCQATSG